MIASLETRPCPRAWSQQRSIVVVFLGILASVVLGGVSIAQPNEQPQDVKTGFLLDVPVPLTTADATSLTTQLQKLNDAVGDSSRTTVVLRYRDPQASDNLVVPDGDSENGFGDETALEDGLRLARAITGSGLRKLRIVTWLQTPVNGHSTLPIIASDMLIVGSAGQISDASAGEDSSDETITLNYQSIAKRRGLFPEPVVQALVDANIELALVTQVGGNQSFASGEKLKQLRADGKLLSENVLTTSGVPLRLSADLLKEARIAANSANSNDEILGLLDLAELTVVDDDAVIVDPKGILLDITGSIASNRVRRWRSNLNKSITKDGVNTCIVSIDSTGGSLSDSLTVASQFASRQAPLQKVAGFVRGEARGDAALIALACKPLLMKPESRIGGSGGEDLSGLGDRISDEEIDLIAKSTNRPAGLIRGLLDPELKIYRFTQRKTGQVRYASQADMEQSELEQGAEVGDVNRRVDDLWQRGEHIVLSSGLSSAEAIELGLADGTAASLDEVSRRAGLSGTPPPLTDNALVRIVEDLGRSTAFSFLLLFIAISAFSTEMSAPGLGVPGFIGIVCIALFVWMKFLAGTAEWFEIIALVLGLSFIAMEVFVLPGFGIFGLGGFVLTMIGVVLMSQTFVLPHNSFQIAQFTKGVWLALVGIAGLFGGFFAIRYFFPHVPMFSGLVMESGDTALLDQNEKLGDYEYLRGQTGVATTPLRPSGKVKFGDEIVQVVSDGSMIESGDQVRVCEVQATKVVVELVE